MKDYDDSSRRISALDAASEKARMRTLIMPVAGIAAALALILAVFFFKQAFGADRFIDRSGVPQQVFEAPEFKQEPVYFRDFNEGTEGRLIIKRLVLADDPERGEYVATLILYNNSVGVAGVERIECAVYDVNGACIGQFTAAEGVTMDPGSDKTFEFTVPISRDGSEGQLQGIMSYVEWQDAGGARAAFTVPMTMLKGPTWPQG